MYGLFTNDKKQKMKRIREVDDLTNNIAQNNSCERFSFVKKLAVQNS